MNIGRLRRHERTPYNSKARLSWDDDHGKPCMTRGKGVDRSARGLSVEVTDHLPLRSYVLIQTEPSGIAGSACVRHSVRRGMRHLVGLELTPATRWTDTAPPA